MASKNKRFADDGWAVWVNGDDNSTVYINDWLNPAGKSYVDFAVRIRGVKASETLHIYLPFPVTKGTKHSKYSKAIGVNLLGILRTVVTLVCRQDFNAQ